MHSADDADGADAHSSTLILRRFSRNCPDVDHACSGSALALEANLDSDIA